MIKIRIKILIIAWFALLGTTLSGYAQSADYGVKVTTILTPPYTLNLSDYSAFGSQKLMVYLYASDLEISRLPVKLQLKIESVGITIMTQPNIITTPIYLDGGATTMLYGNDLKDYFNLNNLTFQGFTKEAYQRAGQLPEGFYKISVTVLHYYTNREVSNKGVAVSSTGGNIWIAVGKPPTLKFPLNDAYLGQTPGMPITFSWLAGNTGMGSIQYNFQLWELRVNSVNPNIVASTVPVFFEQTTFSTLYTFYPATVMMEPGMRYAWRVTASDAAGTIPFEQKGESEIRTFTYKAACDSVSNLASRAAGRSGHFTWDVGPMHTSYNVEMRNPATAWSKNSETYENKASFFGLEYGSVYEMRVQSVCNSDPTSVSDFTQWQSLKITVPEPAYDTVSCPNCGCDDAKAEVTLTNFTQRNDLAVGDTIANKRGTTRLIIKQIKTDNNGTYEGVCYFWAEIWGLKIPCNFWNLQVNTDNVFINLELESINDPTFLLDVDAALDGLNELADNLNILFEDQPIDTFNIEGVIDYMYVNEENEVIAVEVNDDGTIKERKIGDEKDLEKILLKDEEGREYVVTKKGDVMGAKEYADTDGGKKGEVSDRKDKIEDEAAETPSVAFTAFEKQEYGFDEYTEVKASIQNQYPVLKGDYRPAFKSIAGYSPDAVAISGYNQHTLFKDDMGIPATRQGNKLILLGGPHESEKALYAFDTLAKPEQVVGKLNLKSYTRETKRLIIVSVNGAPVPDEAALKATLNSIYKQSIIHWEVTTATPLDNISFEGDKMSHGGSGITTPYNKDQKTIINAFDAITEMDKEASYLFFVSEVVDKESNIAGYMPLSYNAGFIYGLPNNNTIAHELGHGTFNLYHTFSTENNISPEGTTQNLMDYAGGTELWHYQWDLIHDPQSMFFSFLQDESEGAMVIVAGDPKEDKSLVKEALDLIRNQSLKNKTEEYNIYKDLSKTSEFKYFGNVELLDGYSSKIMVIIGQDAYDDEKINIKTGEIYELDKISTYSESYDYCFNYKDYYKNDFNVAIYCKDIDKDLLKKYLLGEEFNIGNILLEHYVFDNTNVGSTSATIDDNNRVYYYLLSIAQANVKGSNTLPIADKWISQYTTHLKGAGISIGKNISCNITITNPLQKNMISINPTIEGVEFVENEDGFNKYVFKFKDSNGSKNTLSIAVDKEHGDNLGKYLFGTKWNNSRPKEEREWVLTIHNPAVSTNFKAAVESGDIIKQRELTYEALLGSYNGGNAATLTRNKLAETKGVTVYTYSTIGGNVIVDEEPLQFDESEKTKKDIAYPVDINLYVAEGSTPDGSLFYKDNGNDIDFTGKFVEASIALGNKVDGAGIISGYMKGYGYVEYRYENKLGFGWDFGVSIGTITGSYISTNGNPTPFTIEGAGATSYTGAGVLSMGTWVSYDNENDKNVTWEGKSVSIGFSVNTPTNYDLFDVSKGNIETETYLIYPPSK